VLGTTQDVLDDVAYCREVGIDQLTYDFRVDGIEDQMRVMEHLADRVLPIATQLPGFCAIKEDRALVPFDVSPSRVILLDDATV
jgi:hypothetical protein